MSYLRTTVRKVHKPPVNVRCRRLPSPNEFGRLGIEKVPKRFAGGANLSVVHRVHSSVGCLAVVDQIDVRHRGRQNADAGVLLEEKLSHDRPLIVKEMDVARRHASASRARHEVPSLVWYTGDSTVPNNSNCDVWYTSETTVPNNSNLVKK